MVGSRTNSGFNLLKSKTAPHFQLTDKIRIHELAQAYGMPRKDLAAKLRENGFTQAKSHMSALDSFEIMLARGLLAAIGITGADSSATAASAKSKSAANLLLRRKKKKKATANDPARPSNRMCSPLLQMNLPRMRNRPILLRRVPSRNPPLMNVAPRNTPGKEIHHKPPNQALRRTRVSSRTARKRVFGPIGMRTGRGEQQ